MGPTVTEPLQDPLAVLLLDNQLNIFWKLLPVKSEKVVAFLNLLKSNKSEVFSQIFSNSAVFEISKKVWSQKIEKVQLKLNLQLTWMTKCQHVTPIKNFYCLNIQFNSIQMDMVDPSILCESSLWSDSSTYP